jgi:hypothetical protein
MVNIIHNHVTFTTMEIEAAYCPNRGTTLSNMSRPITFTKLSHGDLKLREVSNLCPGTHISLPYDRILHCNSYCFIPTLSEY